MGGVERRRALVIAAGALILLLGLGLAFAQQPSATVIEQHWELLGRPVSAASATTETVLRGVLPGGTTKFNATPVATLEVFAKVTGAGIAADQLTPKPEDIPDTIFRGYYYERTTAVCYLETRVREQPK